MMVHGRLVVVAAALLLAANTVGAGEEEAAAATQCAAEADEAQAAAGTGHTEMDNYADAEGVVVMREEPGEDAAASAAAEDAARKELLLESHDSTIQLVMMVCAVCAGFFGLLVFVICCTDDTSPDRGAYGVQEGGAELMDVLARMHLPPCENCGAKTAANELCPDCQVVAYCTPACRDGHKEKHADVCGRLAAIRNKHLAAPPVPQDVEPDVPEKTISAEMGYFTEWDPKAPFHILKDVATYFVKYRGDIMEVSFEYLAQVGRGLVLIDVSTERFKPLHATDDPVRMMYITPQTLRTDPRLALFACESVADKISAYDPTCSSVVAFTNGFAYMERPNATCPVFVLHHDEEQACRTIRGLNNSVLVSLESR